MTIAYSTFQNDESFEAKLLLSEQELSQTRSALESSHAERRRLASLLAARNDIIASVQRSIRGFEHPSVVDEAVSIKGSRGPETSVVFDPEGNDLYEGYNDEDEDMGEEPVAVPGYQEVSEGDDCERKKDSRVSLNFSSSPSPSFLLPIPSPGGLHPILQDADSTSLSLPALILPGTRVGEYWLRVSLHPLQYELFEFSEAELSDNGLDYELGYPLESPPYIPAPSPSYSPRSFSP